MNYRLCAIRILALQLRQRKEVKKGAHTKERAPEALTSEALKRASGPLLPSQELDLTEPPASRQQFSNGQSPQPRLVAES